MPVDARPFMQLETPTGSCKCLRPVLRPLTLGVTGDAGRIAQDQPTHSIDVPVALTTPPADLIENTQVRVDVIPGQWQAFRILRNGIDRGAGMWTLWVRAETDLLPSGVPDDGYEP